MPILTCAVVSHLVEALTIAWEIINYKCPANAMLPVTLMGVFATQTYLTCKYNAGGMIKEPDPKLLKAMSVMVPTIWATWLAAAGSIMSRKK